MNNTEEASYWLKLATDYEEAQTMYSILSGRLIEASNALDKAQNNLVGAMQAQLKQRIVVGRHLYQLNQNWLVREKVDLVLRTGEQDG
jgi:hypothetical protein